MMHPMASHLVKTTYLPPIRVMPINSTALIAVAALLVTICLGVDQVRRHKKAAMRERLKPDYDLLDEVVITIGRLESLPGRKADMTDLSELRNRVKQAERRSPDLPFGDVVAWIDVYQKAALPDCYGKKLPTRRGDLDQLLDQLLELSRQQGTALTEIKTACNALQRKLDRRIN